MTPISARFVMRPTLTNPHRPRLRAVDNSSAPGTRRARCHAAEVVELDVEDVVEELAEPESAAGSFLAVSPDVLLPSAAGFFESLVDVVVDAGEVDELDDRLSVR